MRIRTGTATDHPGVLEVHRHASVTPPTPDRMDRVATKISTELLVVAEDDKTGSEPEIVGFALGEAGRSERGNGGIRDGVMHVSMVFVTPARQREGVGSALLEGLADAGWEQGCRTLSVWSSTPAFYQACGLEPTGEQEPTTDGRTALRLAAELEPPARQVILDGPGIRLGQLLKFAGIVDTGAEAKSLLAASEVDVNGEVDTRRGRQLRDGDQVRARDQSVVVRLPSAT